MNERIRELKDQAWTLVSIEERDRGELYQAQEQWERCDQKFAELIVRECMEQVWYTREDGINGNISEVIKERMKQHFGVEEQKKVAPKPRCSVCGTTENVKYMGGYQPYLCDSVDCIPF